MKTTISKSDFRDAFYRAGRASQFSYEALGMIYEYLEELDEDGELDVIAVCCEFSEQTPTEIIAAYSIDIDGDDIDQQVEDYLRDETPFIGRTDAGTIVYVQF